MTEVDSKTRKLPRRYKVILGASLAINLAVIGLMAGAAFRFGDQGGPGGLRTAGIGAYGLPYMIALPKQERRDVIRAVRADREGVGHGRETRRAQYNDVLAALRATPFEIDRVNTALAAQADTTIKVQLSAQAAWLSVVSAMSEAERQDYADKVEEVLNRGPRHRR